MNTALSNVFQRVLFRRLNIIMRLVLTEAFIRYILLVFIMK